MPTLATATNSFCERFNDAWANRTAIEWPNVAVEGTHLSDGNDPWVALDVLFEGGWRTAISGELYTRTGTVVVRIFVPLGERGLGLANELAMAAADVFEGQTIDGVTFNHVYTRTVGPDGAWFQVNVRAEFEFDEAKT